MSNKLNDKVMKIKAFIISGVSLAIIAAVFTACSGDKSQETHREEADQIMEEIQQEEQTSAQKVFYALPSPFEVAMLIKASGANFTPEVMNSVENAAKYSTMQQKALNIGVYGADLSLAIIFGQSQSAINYIAQIKDLTESLGVTEAFDNQQMEKIDHVKDNPDSLKRLVSESYQMADSYLKDNERQSVAGLILTGGWLEGLYITTQLIDVENPNPDLVELIGEQRFTLENILGLLQPYKEDENVKEVYQDMEALYQIFEKVEETEEVNVQKQDKLKGMVIGGETTVKISPEVLKQIKEKVAEIRNKYTQG
ncbi:MAG: hypothetical protein D6707_00660 [Bacteroidetes bacterium]|nr:MAG: hypothetical protein D6707_00660 [Bacteroidota bacterium]